MDKDTMFVATGAAAIAYKTDGARIDYGVNAIGRRCGVFGSSNAEFGRQTKYAGVGVWGDGQVEGVHGRGSQVNADSVGVYGEGTKHGVEGYSGAGAGVFGKSGAGRGGVFDCEPGGLAQIHLVPLHVDSSTPEWRIVDALPADGKAGDLLALTTDKGLNASLFFCTRSRTQDANGPINAAWAQIQVSGDMIGEKK